MLGTNAVRKGIEGDGSRLQVREIWSTIQGEGPFSGYPAIFIRLTGCNLRCWFCDTAWDDANDPTMTVEEIMAQVRSKSLTKTATFAPGLVVLTGGEPTRQNLSALIPALNDAGFHVQIETDGLFWQDCMAGSQITIVVSPKTPKIDENVWTMANAFKYVIRAGEVDYLDGLPDKSTQVQGAPSRLARPRPGAPVYLTPCDEPKESDVFQVRTKANIHAVGQSALRHGYIAQVQVHKLLDLP